MNNGQRPRMTRRAGRRPALALATIALWALSPAFARGQAAPVASFSVSPAAPLTGETVTFTSTSSGSDTSLAWDLDADGEFDDGSGTTAQRSFATPGRNLVSLRVTGSGGAAEQSQWVEVQNRAPVAAITFSPSAPLANDVVTFAAAASDPDGSIAGIAWDLDDDGSFTDATGPVASTPFPSPGSHTVAVEVTDSFGATAVASQVVAIAPRPVPPPEFLLPFPTVRLITKLTRRGAQIRRLEVQAPPSSRVSVHCRGRSCPVRAQVALVRALRPLRLRALEHSMRAGVVLEVRVTAADRIGKYTQFRLRRGKPPARVDLCLQPGQAAPVRCPPA
jgi:PKD domain